MLQKSHFGVISMKKTNDLLFEFLEDYKKAGFF